MATSYSSIYARKNLVIWTGIIVHKEWRAPPYASSDFFFMASGLANFHFLRLIDIKKIAHNSVYSSSVVYAAIS